MSRRVLYQFPISHYCEKARFCLDLKGLDYEVRNLFPGVHTSVLRKLGGRTVPLLVDGDAVLRDSAEIAHHLDRVRPAPRLVPEDEAEAREVGALVTFFDAEVGPAVRRWAYGHVLPAKGAFEAIFFEQYGPVARAVGRILARGIKPRIRAMYRIGGEAEAESMAIVRDALDRIDARLAGKPERPLVGSSLSLADVTAASILAVVGAPTGSPYTLSERMPRALHEMKAAIDARPVGHWLGWIYAGARRAQSSTVA